MAIAKRNIDWVPVREHFLTAPERPTWSELETQFGIPAGRLQQTASDEGWVILRAKKTAALLERSGAHELLLAAAMQQQIITDKFCGVALSTVEGLEKVLAEIDTEKEDGKTLAASTRSGILNTVSFALTNLARALKESGVVGLPRALMNELEAKMPKGEEGKDFLRTALQQINLTVNLAREGRALDAVTVTANPPPYPRGGVHGVRARRTAEEAEVI